MADTELEKLLEVIVEQINALTESVERTERAALLNGLSVLVIRAELNTMDRRLKRMEARSTEH